MRHGNINLLGFGRGLSGLPLATIAASAAGSAVAIGSRALGYAKYSEGIGLFAGIAAGGALWASGDKAGGKLAMAVTVANSGLRLLEQFLMSSAPSLGWASYESANPALGMPSAQQIAGGGMGYAMATQQPHAYGTVPGVAGPMMDTGRPPVSQSNGAGMAALYGATLY